MSMDQFIGALIDRLDDDDDDDYVIDDLYEMIQAIDVWNDEED